MQSTLVSSPASYVLFATQTYRNTWAKKVSMHQTGFQEVLASTSLMRDEPQQRALIGVQPEQLDDYGGSLRPSIQKRIPEAIRCACELLSEWGIEVRERSDALDPADLVGPKELDIRRYELGRPQ